MKACNQCGKCCVNYSDGGLSASESEIDYWENFRPDIFEYVKGGEIWFSPETERQLTRCPWLRQGQDSKYTCDIYQDRPEDCRHYPVTVDQMIEDDCDMLEPVDLRNEKRAQKILDEMMSDSRPPVL